MSLIERFDHLLNCTQFSPADHATFAEARAQLEAMQAEVELLRDLLGDAAAFIRGDDSGSAQKDGLLREISASLGGE